MTGDGVGARGALEFDPTDQLTITLSGHYFRDEAFGNIVLRNPFPVASLIALGAVNTPDPFEFTSDVDQIGELKDQSGAATLVWDGATTQFKSISAYQEMSFPRLIDSDGTAVNRLRIESFSDSKTWSQEFQLLSKGDSALTWIAGLYYLTEDATQTQTPSAFGVPAPTLAHQVETKASAAFAQLSYQLTDRLSGTLGLRYSRDEKSLAVQSNGVPQVVSEPSKTFSATTPKIGLEYKSSDDVLWYLSLSRGYKSGGFPNTTAAGTPPFAPFEPEDLRAYEAGVKSTFADGRLTANLAAFYYDYENLQIIQTAILGVSQEVITPNARNYGAEIEIGWRPSSPALFTAAVALLEAEFSDSLIVTNTSSNVPVDLKGLSVPRSPDLQYSVTGQYRVALGNLGSLLPRIEYVYQGAVALNQFNDPKNNEGSYGLLNARLQWDFPGDHASLALWGKNLSDEVYRTTSNTSLAIGQFDVYGAPRTYGADFVYKF